MTDFPHIRAVLAGPIPDLVLAEWQALAAEHSDTGTYASYLSFERLYPYHGDELTAAVANTAPHARVLEDGHSGYHLPSVIDWGAALAKGTAKMSARGVPYLSIPFRHYTPGGAAGGISSGRRRSMMPDDVYRDAMTALRGADRQRRVDAAVRLREAGTRLSRPYALMQGAPRRGLTLDALRLKALHQEGQPGYTWRSRTYEGLRYTQQANPETGRASGVFETFRTLAGDSVGWWIPPFPGYHFAARTVEAVLPQVQTLIGEAARADVAEMVSLVTGGQA